MSEDWSEYEEQAVLQAVGQHWRPFYEVHAYAPTDLDRPTLRAILTHLCLQGKIEVARLSAVASESEEYRRTDRPM